MARKIVIICIDALGPEYLERSPTPNVDRMGKEGVFLIGQGVVPSVTNVNNVSILTGVAPRIHGITSNYWVDRGTGAGRYMESPDFLCYPTALERAKRAGMSTALLTSKKKLQGLLDVGADYSLCAEDPDEDMIRNVGPKEDIYSPGVNLWLFRALRLVLKAKRSRLGVLFHHGWDDAQVCARRGGIHQAHPGHGCSIGADPRRPSGSGDPPDRGSRDVGKDPRC